MKRLLVIGVILLFLGVTIAPTINYSTVKATQALGHVNVTSQTCGVAKFRKATYYNNSHCLVFFNGPGVSFSDNILSFLGLILLSLSLFGLLLFKIGLLLIYLGLVKPLVLLNNVEIDGYAENCYTIGTNGFQHFSGSCRGTIQGFSGIRLFGGIEIPGNRLLGAIEPSMILIGTASNVSLCNY